MSKFYVLEVVRFITEKDGENGWLIKGTKLEHVGYMKVKFRTKKDACSYYNKYNPDMRPLNANGDYKSAWNPTTKLLYIVRKYYGLYMSIEPFVGEELPFNGETYLYNNEDII